MVIVIKKSLKKPLLYFYITIIIATIIGCLYSMKINSKNNKIDEVLLITSETIKSDLYDHNKKSRNRELYDYISKDEINKMIIEFQNHNRLNKAYLLKACVNIADNEYDEAKDNLNKSLRSVNPFTSIKLKTYAGTFLSKIYLANDDFFKASEVVRYCLANINSKNYNKYYKEIWMLMDTISDKESGQSKIILWDTDILESHKNLSNEAKLYFILELKELYIKHGNYAKASEYAIKGCYLAYDLNDNYCLSRCMINLGRILREIENRDRAVELIKDALELPIEDKSHEAYRDVYAYINLGEIYLESGNYEEAKKTVENISSYKVYFDEEEFRNIEIRRILILADKNFYENNLDEGKKLLDKADELIKENKNNISSDVYLNYNSLHGTYLEQTTNYKEAIELYNEILQWCVDKNDIYNQRKIMKKIMNVAINSKDYKLEEEYILKLAGLINNTEDIIYSDYSYYVLETVKSEVSIEREKHKNKFIFKVLSLTLVSSLIIFLISYTKIKKLRVQNQKDGLTKSYNRFYFNELYESFIREDTNFSIMMIDIDNFKSLNDTYGHQFGDTVLINVCNTISKIIDKDSKLCRYGGEEFVVVSSNKSRQELEEISEKIRVEVEKIAFQQNVKVTLSIGVAMSCDNKEDTLNVADKNLYIAKTTGKNKVVFEH